MRTRIKVCGITRSEDIVQASLLGVDALGFVFYSASPRVVTAEQASNLVKFVSPFISRVALFVDAQPHEIEQILTKVSFSVLQFHGNEAPEECRRYGLPYIKAVHMQPGVDLEQYGDKYYDAAALLLDTYHPTQKGGTGCSFDWEQIPRDLAKPLILSGGLTPENVAQAILQVHPYAVDVSSGVEVAPGIKDPDKLCAFVKSCRIVSS